MILSSYLMLPSGVQDIMGASKRVVVVHDRSSSRQFAAKQYRVNERDGLRTDGAHTRVLLYELVVYIYIYSVYILCIILLLASSTTLYGY